MISNTKPQSIASEVQEDDGTKKYCIMCEKYTCANKFARHKRICPKRDEYFLKQQMKDLQSLYDLAREETVNKSKEIDELKQSQVQYITNHNNTVNNTVNNSLSVNNNTLNINYKFHCRGRDGKKDGLDLKKIFAIGQENMSYVDKQKSIPDILSDIYLHPEHPENRVISFGDDDKVHLLVKFPDEIREYNIYGDFPKTVDKFTKMILENLEKHDIHVEETDHKERRLFALNLIQKVSLKHNSNNKEISWNEGMLDGYYITPA